ncbi:MAG: hypothetical protein AAGC96_09755, partial [Pseudomonadota bacterium]
TRTRTKLQGASSIEFSLPPPGSLGSTIELSCSFTQASQCGHKEHPGSWWPHWDAWVKKQDNSMVDPREPGGGKLNSIEDAPGSFVRVRV